MGKRTLTIKKEKEKKVTKEKEKKPSSYYSIYFKSFTFEILITIALILFVIYQIYFILGLKNWNYLFDIIFIVMNIILIFLTQEQLVFDRRFKDNKRKNGFPLLISFCFLNIASIYFTIKSYYALPLDHVDIFIYISTSTLGLIILTTILIVSCIKTFKKMKNLTRAPPNLAFTLNTIPFILLAIGIVALTINSGMLISYSSSIAFKGADISEAWDWVAFTRNMLIISVFPIFFLFAEWRYDLFMKWDNKYWGYR